MDREKRPNEYRGRDGNRRKRKNTRRQRFSMLVDNGVIKQLNIEAPGKFELLAKEIALRMRHRAGENEQLTSALEKSVTHSRVLEQEMVILELVEVGSRNATTNCKPALLPGFCCFSAPSKLPTGTFRGRVSPR